MKNPATITVTQTTFNKLKQLRKHSDFLSWDAMLNDLIDMACDSYNLVITDGNDSEPMT